MEDSKKFNPKALYERFANAVSRFFWWTLMGGEKTNRSESTNFFVRLAKVAQENGVVINEATSSEIKARQFIVIAACMMVFVVSAIGFVAFDMYGPTILKENRIYSLNTLYYMENGWLGGDLVGSGPNEVVSDNWVVPMQTESGKTVYVDLNSMQGNYTGFIPATLRISKDRQPGCLIDNFHNPTIWICGFPLFTQKDVIGQGSGLYSTDK